MLAEQACPVFSPLGLASEVGGMANVGSSAVSKDEPQESSAAGVTTVPPFSPPVRSGVWAKDHCDYLLDSIDAQLSQLQAQRPTSKIKGNSSDGMASLDGTGGVSRVADLGGGSGDGDREASLAEEASSQMEEDLGDQSRSDSVCTEDLAARFQAGLVNLLLSSESEAEEDTFALAVLPSDIQLLQSQAESTSPSQPSADSESALDSARKQDRAPSLQDVSRREWGQESMIPCSEEPPSPCARHKIWSLESLDKKISLLSQKDLEQTADTLDTLGDNSAWRKGLQPRRPLNLGELGGSAVTSGEKASWAPGQRSKGFEVWVQDLHKSSSSPLLVGDLALWPPVEVGVVPVKMPLCDSEAPARTVRPCVPKKGPADCQKNLLDATGLHALPGSRNRCWAPSGAEDRGGLIPPGWPSPLTTFRTGEMQRPALSSLRRKTDGTVLPRASQKPLRVTSGGCLEPRKNWATGAPHPKGHGEALGLMESTGCSTEGSHLPRQDLLRLTVQDGRPLSYGPFMSLGSSDGGTEEEEELARLCPSSNRGTGCPVKQAPSQAANPTWKAALLGTYRGLELQEEKISPKMAPTDLADVPLHAILQQKKCLAFELEALQEALEEGHKEIRRLTLRLEESQSKVDETRADLVLLECQREASRRELLGLEKELGTLRRQGSRLGAAQAEVSRLVAEREELKDHVRLLEEQLSSLKLQLRSTGAELTSVKEMADKSKQLQEAILSEKEGDLLRLRKTVSALEAEKEAQSCAMERLKAEKESQLERLQREAHQEKEKGLFQLREELQREKRQALQEFAERTEQAKASLLQEQAAGFQKEVENLCKAIEERDAELLRREEAQRQREKKLKQEGEEMVQNALLQEQKRWEADTRAALQMQREALQEQNQRAQAGLQEALEGERKTHQALQETAASLHTTIQKLESQVQAVQVEKVAAMEELQARLQKEKAEALEQLQEELEQERRQKMDQTRAKMQQMEEDQRLLRAELSKRESQAPEGWAERSLAQEVALACQQLQDLLPKKAGGAFLSPMFHGSPALLPSSRLLQALREVCQEIQLYLQDLKHEMEMQRHNILQIQREKAHMEDIAALQRSWLREAGPKEDPRPPHQPLQEKDREPWAMEMNPVCWREQLAREFKEELNAELEKHLSRGKPMKFPRELEMPESEIQPISMGNYFPPHPGCSRWLSAAAMFSSQHHAIIPKLLHRLQNRIQELRAENAAYCRANLGSRSSFQEDLADTCSSKKHLPAGIASSPLCGSSSWK